mgnify:CR=1 FL=1
MVITSMVLFLEVPMDVEPEVVQLSEHLEDESTSQDR